MLNAEITIIGQKCSSLLTKSTLILILLCLFQRRIAAVFDLICVSFFVNNVHCIKNVN